jgi:valyl-tRNA synthetase
MLKAREREAQAQRKLGNPSFISNAPPEVVAKVRAELNEYRATLRAIEDRLKEL